ncbi:CAP domain-containing protein [Amycolatopsis sp. cg9]|uniref:CAP domain-containing protein n=1 Tax=Amycolatopsis sp. cg9 TaxID=3238801 RepID=UPI0035269A06
MFLEFAVVLTLVAPVPAAAAGAGSYPTQVLQLTNVQRVKYGCGPLADNPLLADAADGHTGEMARYRYFSHTGRAGEDPAARISAAGYRWQRWAENIAAGQRTPEQVVDSWMHSPVHKANILDCRLTELGVGYTVDSARKAYWTQDFGTPRG